MNKEQLYNILRNFNDTLGNALGISVWLQPSSNLVIVKPMSVKTEHLAQPNLYDPELGNLIACFEPDEPNLWLKLLDTLANVYKALHPSQPEDLSDLPF